MTAKIVDLETLSEFVVDLKQQGKRVVHCHGVFDLLHIGHIRHLQQARQLADALIVTVTPDRFVNKGTHRPAFGQELRLEAIAALDVVDYVAVNRWPTAVECIDFLRPDLFVKGSEFKDGKDITGHILVEKQAVERVGGQLAFTDGITFSSSSLINCHLSAHSPEAQQFLEGFRTDYETDAVLAYLEQARKLRVLVIGETIIDEYCYCEAMGKTGKEPVIAAMHQSDERFAGGVLAAANHVASFCDQVGLISMLGDTATMEPFVREHLLTNIEASFLYKEKSPTILKRRFIDQFALQKLFEVYEINDAPLSARQEKQFCKLLRQRVPAYDVVVVTDYGHGMMTPAVIATLCEQARFLAVNTQVNAGNRGFNTISKYPRADYVCLTFREFAYDIRDLHQTPQSMMEAVAQKLNCPNIMLTRGQFGNIMLSQANGFCQVPAFAGKVIDRVGAGDAVFSITSLLVAQQTPAPVVGFVGNVVGAQAVMTVGNREPVKPVPLSRHIVSLMK